MEVAHEVDVEPKHKLTLYLTNHELMHLRHILRPPSGKHISADSRDVGEKLYNTLNVVNAKPVTP